jgi:hypothetical protein
MVGGTAKRRRGGHSRASKRERQAGPLAGFGKVRTAEPVLLVYWEFGVYVRDPLTTNSQKLPSKQHKNFASLGEAKTFAAWLYAKHGRDGVIVQYLPGEGED